MSLTPRQWRDQSVYVARFNRTCREKVFDLYLFSNLGEVGEITHWWLADDNEE